MENTKSNCTAIAVSALSQGSPPTLEYDSDVWPKAGKTTALKSTQLGAAKIHCTYMAALLKCIMKSSKGDMGLESLKGTNLSGG